MTFKQLRRNLKNDFSEFREVKIALLADSASQLLAVAIRGCGYEHQLDLKVHEADYDQINQELLNPHSEYYTTAQDFTILFHSVHKLRKKFYQLPIDERKDFASNHIAHCQTLFDSITSNTNSKIIYFNFPIVNDEVFGHHANKTQHSFIYQLRKINFQLMEVSQQNAALYIHDLQALQGRYGQDVVLDTNMYINADMPLSVDFLPVVADSTIAIIRASLGKIKKCLVLDLDNTIWGGIIGDDGLEKIQIGDLGVGKAFSEFQQWAKELKERGVILAICSKNDEKNAKEPFEKHPDMVLRLDDIAIFVANWENKADNIAFIQQTLNIGLDSIVFIDDNPFERNMVRTHLPQVTVPELPEDPALYLNYLTSLYLFETVSFTTNDSDRTRQYQAEAKRVVTKNSFANEEEFLASLDMKAKIESFNRFNTPRVAQLTQRSNQFNLRTIRYTEHEIEKIANSEDYITLSLSLSDKFGDHGIISVLILEKKGEATLFVDTWIMSCRVLKRGVEYFALNKLVEIAKKHQAKQLRGEYLPTAKNGLVKDHYADLGFQAEDGYWVLDVASFSEKENYIQEDQLINLTNG
ncbi:HAD-IIIC family phosphatase [Tunicatimonas pelagia]|uniref:HAD-IIIC family phosphatase n=1 Tax=Tunicatimonas pelagia TaxID=931531 RepID=UPI0026654AEE|nr:HAD-IIIC family phosphatase [Tunicatimonas pelagia]WKN42335.1 HAD-IIIC family phosphatase [Tunicatimonas pelagia]